MCEVIAPMVFCRQCKQNVEDCVHFVPPIPGKRLHVIDAKVDTLAYDLDRRTLEIAFKSGQVWQLQGVPPAIYKELCDSTISSFLRFIARRYPSAPVRKPSSISPVPKVTVCSNCKSPMKERHRRDSAFGKIIKVVWTCPQCGRTEWKTYDRESRQGP